MFIELGEIVNVVGLRGELKLLVTGNFDERILRSGFLRLERPGGTVEPVNCRRDRPKGGAMIVQLDEVVDRESAEALVGGRLGFLAADYDAPEFPRGERPAAFLYLDCEVVTTEGDVVGRVEDVLTLPANWVLRVRTADGREQLVPVIDDVVREMDRESGRVLIEAIPGLLDGEGE
jgi:16S rRNA processing protein RimM